MAEEWWPNEIQWKNQISKDDWKKLLTDDKIFTDKSKIFLKRLLHKGGEATCADLAKEYGRTASFYIGVEQGLANRILKEKKLDPITDGNREWKFPVLFLGRHVDKSKDENSGDYIWKLRPELKKALEESGYKQVVIAGGVAANSEIRKKVFALENGGYKVFAPPMKYCTDNAAMVAACAYFSKNTFDDVDVEVFSRIK